MKRFQSLLNVRNNLRNLHKEAAIDSLRNVLAVLGLGVLIGDFATMRLPYVVPGAIILVLVWYADYLRHDLPATTAIVAEKKDSLADHHLIDPIEHLSRVS